MTDTVELLDLRDGRPDCAGFEHGVAITLPADSLVVRSEAKPTT